MRSMHGTESVRLHVCSSPPGKLDLSTGVRPEAQPSPWDLSPKGKGRRRGRAPTQAGGRTREGLGPTGGPRTQPGSERRGGVGEAQQQRRQQGSSAPSPGERSRFLPPSLPADRAGPASVQGPGTETQKSTHPRDPLPGRAPASPELWGSHPHLGPCFPGKGAKVEITEPRQRAVGGGLGPARGTRSLSIY